MASSYSTIGRIELMATGEKTDLWGPIANTGLQLLEDMIAGATTITDLGGTVTLSANNGATDQSRRAMLICTAALTSNLTLVIPNLTKSYFIFNRTTNAYTVSVKTSGGSAIAVPQGTVAIIACDGANVCSFFGAPVSPTTGLMSSTLLSTLLDLISSTQGTVLYRGASAWSGLAPGTSGYFLKTQGAAANPAWAVPSSIDIQVFTASGTWTKPAGLRSVKVTVVGGGGGGGGPEALAAKVGAGAGGGGGGTAIKYIDAASLGATETVTVGAGGNGGVSDGSSGAAGSTGGTSSFGAHCSATGGSGGDRHSTAATTPGGQNGGVGGEGAGGDFNIQGHAGEMAVRFDGNEGIGGAGGGSTHGGGGRNVQQGSGGSTGGNYGGGGGGGVTNSATARHGGDGFAGIVIVEEFF